MSVDCHQGQSPVSGATGIAFQGLSLQHKSGSFHRYTTNTIICLITLIVSALFCFGMLQLSLSKSPLTFAISFGSTESLFNCGVRGLTALAVAVLVSLGAAWLTFPIALSVFVFAVLLVAVVYYAVPGNSFDPSFPAVVAMFLAVFAAYCVGAFRDRVFHQRKVSEFFRHYVPSNLTDYYIDNPSGMDAVSDSRELTIIFCDIKRFTTIAETLDPDRLRDWLNAYFGVVSRVIHQHGGTVDKYMGDSVMAFWGAPETSDSHASDALYASRRIQEEVSVLSQQMQNLGLPPITIGIGMATGFANVGHMGSRYHMTYTAVGDPVNTANRLQRCTGYYDISVVVAESTVEKVPQYLFRELDTVHVKGRQRFVRLFEPVCPAEEASPDLHKRLQLHGKAMLFYRQGMWSDAERLFAKLGRDDLANREFYKKYVDRIQKIRTTSPEDQSAHILDLTQKIG